MATTTTTTAASNGRDGLTVATWWTVDRSHEPPLKVGATPLVERCIRSYGWNEDFAKRVLHGYRRFLSFKHTFEDWDAKKFSPSLAIDKIWHQHILDTRNYSKDCELLFGRIIDHDPDGGLDQDARKKRITRTMDAVRLQYGDDYDKEVWYFGVEILGREAQERQERMLQQRRDSRIVSPADVGPLITVRVRDQVGEVTFFRVLKTTQMKKIFEAYAQHIGVQAVSLRFLLDGERFEGDLTPEMLELEDQDFIGVMIEQTGC